jgi:hypothetical protein
MIAKTGDCKEARHSVRLRALAIAIASALVFHAPPAQAAGPDAQPVALSIANAGAEPIHCLILFAHFVATETGTIQPNGEVSIAMFRQGSDGALWIPRADGRRMMIETIDCAATSHWAETRGQISLLPARAGRDARYGTRCRLSGAVVCADPAPLP